MIMFENRDPKALIALILGLICLPLVPGLSRDAGAYTVKPPEEVTPPPKVKAPAAKRKRKPKKKPVVRPEPEEETTPTIQPATPPAAKPPQPPAPLPDRFTFTSEGIIQDTKTGLEWYEKGNQVTYYEADAWAKGLTLGGGGWRLPSLNEVHSIYVKGDEKVSYNYKNNPLCSIFKNIWTIDTLYITDDGSTWNYFYMVSIHDANTNISNKGHRADAFAVRNRR